MTLHLRESLQPAEIFLYPALGELKRWPSSGDDFPGQRWTG
jgi:hypothetical protein